MPRKKNKKRKQYIKSTLIFEGKDISLDGGSELAVKRAGVQKREKVQKVGDMFEADDGEAQKGKSRITRFSHGLVQADLDVRACHMCGRTILAGETTELYQTQDSKKDPLRICSICRPQARSSGFSKVA